MKRTAIALPLSLALLFSMGAMTPQARYCLSSDVHVYNDTIVYDVFGRNVNVTITPDLPEIKDYNVTVAFFTLKIAASILAPLGGVVDSSQYLVTPNQASFSDCYLVSGFIVDYDRAELIDMPWENWGDSPHSYDAVLSQSADTYYGSTILPELSEGTHNLTVWVRAEQNVLSLVHFIWVAFSKTVTFTKDTVAPTVAVLAPENSTHKASNAPLNFTVNEPFSKVTYSLDGKDNVTIRGNTTLTELPNGDHNVTVYATDETGNTGASETMYFSVDAPEPFPAASVVSASIATAVVIGVGLRVYFKKRKR